LQDDDFLYCRDLQDNCNITTSDTTLSNCDSKQADYYHLRYRCVPAYSSVIRSYNVCDRVLNILTTSTGFMQSPNYPTYQMVPNECTTKIVAVNNNRFLLKLNRMYTFFYHFFESNKMIEINEYH
jgi:hypothetical protein